MLRACTSVALVVMLSTVSLRSAGAAKRRSVSGRAHARRRSAAKRARRLHAGDSQRHAVSRPHAADAGVAPDQLARHAGRFLHRSHKFTSSAGNCSAAARSKSLGPVASPASANSARNNPASASPAGPRRCRESRFVSWAHRSRELSSASRRRAHFISTNSNCSADITSAIQRRRAANVSANGIRCPAVVSDHGLSRGCDRQFSRRCAAIHGIHIGAASPHRSPIHLPAREIFKSFPDRPRIIPTLRWPPASAVKWLLWAI